MVRREGLARLAWAFAPLLAVACEAERSVARRPPGAPARRAPQVEATVLTIRESSHPPTRAVLHRILVHGSRVRSTEELDRWRLFDLEAQTVTWVDQIAGTHRTLALDDLVRARRRQLRAPIPSDLPPISVRKTEETMEIAGYPAEQWVMELGGYRRVVWTSLEPIVAPHFLRMWVASSPISEPWAGVMRESEEALFEIEGFPLWDRSELAWEGGGMVSERRLILVEKRRVPRSFFEIPEDYEDTTPPAIRSGGGRRRAS
ncbi:MAG TPA: hypothetical protein VMS56_11815 [Thermoanaerobaculia bacterium]|nr:hypothetical protein [Thermoanaerobaculia bacterium]